MTNFVKGIIFLLFLLNSIDSFAQKNQRKFGDIKPSDFSASSYSIDTPTNAVVLFDIGSSKYEGSASGGLSLIYKRHKRIRLINRNSFDLATISLPVYSNGTEEEKIESLEACTYNLENGKVETFKLDKSSIFKDKLDKNFSVRKFTLPNLKEGSIIEIKYTLNSPYETYMRPWNFQGSTPVLYSEYQVEIPDFYEFVVIGNGHQPYILDTGYYSHDTYNIVDHGTLASDRTRSATVNANVVVHKWAMKDVPALKEEDFTTTIDNHLSKVEFQLARIKFPNSAVKDVIKNWFSVSNDLLKDEGFGEPLTKSNGWLSDEIKKITAGAGTTLEAAKKIFEYVRDNMNCTDYSNIKLSNSLKKIYQNKNGNVADINLLLTAALINQGFNASPVLLSTRDHGKVNATYPIMSQLNYVISQVNIDGKNYLLDAAHNRLGFGKLNIQCYNGPARIIDKENPVQVDLSPDSLVEAKVTNAFFNYDPKDGLQGTITSQLGQYESEKVREKIAKIGKEDFFKEIKKHLSSDLIVSETDVEELKNYEEPIRVKYNLGIETKEDVIYLNPIFGEAYKENPFKAAERLYPVEMPYAMNEQYVLRMEIPKGYAVEEMPKSTRVMFNEDEGMFEYLVSKDENVIQLRSSIKMNKATFFTEDYQSLRDFFGYIVKKHSEQIVLKKVK